MMKPAPHYGQEVTLVPLSGLQFLDFALKLDKSVRIDGFSWENRWFAEKPVIQDGEERQQLLQLDSVDGVLRDGVSGTEIEREDAYAVDIMKTIDSFVGQWTPIPYFRIIGTDAQHLDVHDRGPTNWARLYVAKPPEPDHEGRTHRLVIAFDTDVEDANRTEGGNYAMPTRQDAQTEDRFSFSAAAADLYWFLGQVWIEDWLTASFAALPKKPRRPTAEPDQVPREFEALARYVVLIQTLAALAPLPTVRLVDTFSDPLNYRPIPVDLIVDVGNSRTCGILIENHGDRDSRLDLSRSDPLSLRDLSRPEFVYGDAFQSRVEFSRPYFGDEGISRGSGRRRAFQWPSLVRIGPEAVRLSVGGSGTEGATGMSSPKRYLWDRRPIGQNWRTRRPERRDTEVVSGALMQFVTETGEVIMRKRARGAGRGPVQQPAIRPKFSRSSLFMMLVTEILAQTITAINSPERRSRQIYADVPRFLRNIIMTLPPATPLAERRIMAERVEEAIDLVWRTLGWDNEPTRSKHIRRPDVKINLDEATATQLVYLYTEIVQKYAGDPRSFLEIAGKPRKAYGDGATLRVASIDIGGGTSDLIVVTYRVQKASKRVIEPEQNFREGFRVAGDDIVRAVVANHVLPAIETALGASGIQEAKAFLRGVVGGDRGGMAEQERQFRRRFVVQLLEPAALALLGQLEARPYYAENATLEQRLGAAWTADAREADVIAAEFDALAARAGAKAFSLAKVAILSPSDEVNATVRATLSPALTIFAEVIAGFDCDVLLLSGRPSRLPVVSDILVSTLAVRPDRVVPMHRYRTGKWYPFRDAHDRISDPKTTVAVGAMLCFLAESQIENFTVRTRHLTVRSTARYIGEMGLGDKIADADLLFSDIDLEAGPRSAQEALLSVETQTTTIGFRQLPLERWPASPLYTIDVQPRSEHNAVIGFPIRVALQQGNPLEGDGEAAEDSAREDVTIADWEDANGDKPHSIEAVVMKLQTMKSSSGYWLDTGIISDY